MDLDVIVIIETHLRADDEIKINGYDSFMHNRAQRHFNARRSYGGIAVLFKCSLFTDFVITEIDRSYDGILIFSIMHKITTYKILFIACYLPPERSPWGRNADEYFGHISSFINIYAIECDVIYLCGDLNARIGTKDDFVSGIDKIPSRRVLDKNNNKHGDAFIEFLIENKLCVVNGRIDNGTNNFTFISTRGKSVVDFFVVSTDNLNTCVKFEVMQSQYLFEAYCNQAVDLVSGIPDHSMLHLTVKIPFVNEGLEITQTLNANTSVFDMKHVPPSYFSRFKITDVPENFLSSEETNMNIEQLIQRISQWTNVQNDIDEVYKTFCEIYYDEMKKWFKPKNIIGKNKKKLKKCCKPFWCDELQNLWNELRNKENIFLSIEQGDRVQKRAEFRTAQKNFDRVYRKLERQYNRAQLHKFEVACTNEPRQFWKMLKMLGPNKKISIPFEVYDSEGNVSSNHSTVMNKWHDDYKKLYSVANENVDEQFYNNITSDVIDDLKSNVQCLNGLDHEIQEAEVKKLVKQAKDNKAVGIDSIPYEVLKNTKSVKLLTLLFNKMLSFNIFPDVWKLGIVIPIPKPSLKDSRMPLQYRGITLLSTVYKIFTSLLNARLMSVLESENIYEDQQNGFRKKRSCLEHIYTLTTIIRNRKVQKLATFLCFIDFEKAFDRVDRKLLYYKLLKSGIAGKFFNVIESLYLNAKAGVSVNNFLTDWFNVDHGVRQGDSLSATLFGLDINDVVKDLNQCEGIVINDKKITCLLYADDIVLISENENDLQNMLTKLKSWCYKWRMTVNIDKSKVMHCRNKTQEQSGIIFKYGEKELEYVQTYKYLGIVIDAFLDYNVTANMLANSASRALSALYNKFKFNKGLGYLTYTKLYNTGIVPILDYACGIWGYSCFKRSEIIQNKAIRFFLGVHRFACNLSVNGDMGWLTCSVRQKLDILRLWNRLLRIDSQRIVKTVFNWDKTLCKNNWSKEVKMICSEIDLLENFENNMHISLTLAKERLCSNMCMSWKSEVEIVPKLRLYQIFKDNYHTEKYVIKVTNRKKRSILAQFRSGILPLSIETGRYQEIPIEYRLCLFCNRNSIESEVHFLLHCSFYNDIRYEFFNKIRSLDFYFDLLDDEQKIVKLMSDDMIKLTADFLTEAFEKRKRHLYL